MDEKKLRELAEDIQVRADREKDTLNQLTKHDLNRDKISADLQQFTQWAKIIRESLK